MKKATPLLLSLFLFAALAPAQNFFGSCTATGSGASSACFGGEGVNSPTGTAAIGGNTQWHAAHSSVTPMGPTWMVFATTLAAAPITVPGFDGDMLLNPAANVIVTGSLAHPSLGAAYAYHDFPIPNDPMLIGSAVHMQALRVGIGPTGWPILTLSAAWGVTIV